jgi:hypothetical protein
MLPAPITLMLFPVGDTAPPEFPVKVSVTTVLPAKDCQAATFMGLPSKMYPRSAAVLIQIVGTLNWKFDVVGSVVLLMKGTTTWPS